jgi:hypothetical protein
MEEVLRTYFLKSGYFVVRGVPFIYAGFDVTDIDLWLYNRVSSVSRELSIVDIKNKKTPQAIERIFWTKGLQAALGVSKAIVATTESRADVRRFGKDIDVLVLDGRFIKRLSDSSPNMSGRVSDDEFRAMLVDNTLGKLDGDWPGRIRMAKARLASGLSFDSFNYWLGEAHFFAEQALGRQQRQEQALRCMYLTLSFAALAVDYILRDLSFLEESDREAVLRDGFTYGERGQTGTKSLIDLSVNLISEFTERGSALAAEVRSRFDAAVGQLQTNVLSQYFSRAETGRILFEVAKELENLAMAKNFQAHASASTGVRSVIGCVLDFWGIDRRKFGEQQARADDSKETAGAVGTVGANRGDL